MQMPCNGPRELRTRSQETSGKARGASAGYTEASLARKKHARPDRVTEAKTGGHRRPRTAAHVYSRNRKITKLGHVYC
jgi:hypothetical protein